MDNDIELEIGRAAAPGRYQVHVVSSPAGGDQREEFDLDVEHLLRSRPGLEAGILASAVGARRVMTTAEQPVREVGQHLFEALFRRSVYGAYRASLGVAQQQGERLRVILRFAAPELAALPWETLFDPERQTYVCRQEPMVRRIPAQFNPRAPLQVEPPLHVLAMVASPRGLPPLDVERERANLDEALRELTIAGLVEVTWVEQASWRSVHEHLLSGHWHVVHFIGHGDYDEGREEGILAFVGRDGRADLVEAGRFADLLGEADPTPRLVVLNACSSGEGGGNDILSATAPALVHSGIEAVAAMQFAVSDDAAIAFAQGFYTAIAQSRGVDEAARSGRIAILGAAGSLEWLTPVLYLRGDSTHPIVMRPGPTSIPQPRVPVPDRPPDAAAAIPDREEGPPPVVRPEPVAYAGGTEGLRAGDTAPTIPAGPDRERAPGDETREDDVVPPDPGQPQRHWWRLHARSRWVLGGIVAVLGLTAAGLVLLWPPGPVASPPRLGDATALVPMRDAANRFTRTMAFDTTTGRLQPWAGAADRFAGTTSEDVDRFSATPSPDRRKVAYLQRGNGAGPVPYVADAAGGHAHRLMTSAKSPCQFTKRPAWSPDGRQMAVVCFFPRDREWSLWVVDAQDGAGVREVVSRRPANLGAPTWDADDNRIYTWEAPASAPNLSPLGRPTWVSADGSQTGPLPHVPGTKGDRYTEPDWAPPGLLMVHDLPQGNRIVVVSGGHPHPVADGDFQSATWSPDHQSILAVEGATVSRQHLVTFTYADLTRTDTHVTGQFGAPNWGSR